MPRYLEIVYVIVERVRELAGERPEGALLDRLKAMRTGSDGFYEHLLRHTSSRHQSRLALRRTSTMVRRLWPDHQTKSLHRLQVTMLTGEGFRHGEEVSEGSIFPPVPTHRGLLVSSLLAQSDSLDSTTTPDTALAASDAGRSASQRVVSF